VKTYADITVNEPVEVILTTSIDEDSPIYFNFMFTNTNLIYIDELECYIE